MAVDVEVVEVAVVKHPKVNSGGYEMIEERQGIFIWFEHMRNLRQIKRLGHLMYASKKMKYALLYVNHKDIDAIEERLINYSFVKKIERSEKPFLETTYEKDNVDDEKQFDFRLGI